MAASDILAIVLIAVVILAAFGYFIIKSNGKSNRVSTIFKLHPTLAMVLLNCERLPHVSSMTEEQFAKILALSDSDWEEWESLHKRVRSLAEKYPHTLYDFIYSSFPKCKERVNYKKRAKLFTPIPQKVKIAVASLLLEELRNIDADSEEVWKERDQLRLYAESIRQQYPEGYNSFCLVHNDKSPKDTIVVNSKKHIAELQKLYDESKAYEGWEKKQEEFCSKFWQILKEVRSQDGRYAYDVSFNKPNRRGTLIESKFKVWQGFRKCFSSHLINEQDEKFKSNFDIIPTFKNRTRYFYDRVYDQIFEIISKFQENVSGKLYVILIDGCKLKWSERTYNYHYRHIREKIDESEIKRFNFSDLPLINDNGNIGGVFILDFITSNEELKNNCKLIVEHFRKSVPLVGYYSLLKEYDEKELRIFAQKKEGILCSEKKDIEFVKKCMLLIQKHAYFSYLAIPNTWIGKAARSQNVKELWLDSPTKYDFRTKDVAGMISGEFSIDGGKSYEVISMEGDCFDVGETAKFTYLLFKKMGVLSQFKENGHKAIQYMNNHCILAYH